MPVPNLLPPDRQVTSRRAIPPVGFMPIAPLVAMAAEKLRGHAASWDHRRWSELAPAHDIDAGYFNAAPPDQQVAEIRADERWRWRTCTRSTPGSSTNLQAISPRAVAELAAGAARGAAPLRHAVRIDTDRGTASLVWRGSLGSTHPAAAGGSW